MFYIKIIIILIIFNINYSYEKRLDHFYTFGEGIGDTKMTPSDDGSTNEVTIATDFPFFDSIHHSLYVNTNGLISFLRPVSQFTPDAFPLGDNKKFIAPFWTDIDSRKYPAGGIYYREILERNILETISLDIRKSYAKQKRFNATWAFHATWDRVTYFGGIKFPLNSFQAVITTDGRHSYAIFNYGEIKWTTGTASGGNSEGIGGVSAQAGFNAGDGIRYFSIPGSRTEAIRDVGKNSNVGIAGRWIFRIDEAEIIISSCDISVIKEGFSIKLINETLKDFQTPQNGYLEAYACNELGIICGADWNYRLAHIACKEMGFPMGAMKMSIKVSSNELIYNFYISDFLCTGQEKALMECQFQETKSCKHNEIVKLTCNPKLERCSTHQWRCNSGNCILAGFLCDGDKDCRDGSDEDPQKCQTPFEIRLNSEPNIFSGRVEIRRFGVWGTICDDHWDESAARVICKMLGFEGDTAFPQGCSCESNETSIAPNLIWLDEVQCTGTESTLEECLARPWSFHDCSHKQDARVTCSFEVGETTDDPFLSLDKKIELQSSDNEVILQPPVEYGSFPWQVGIRLKIKSLEHTSRHVCSGAILTDFHVLTVAHCFTPNFKRDDYIIRVGDFDQQFIEDEEEDFEIDLIIQHEKFRYVTVFMPTNDIVLIRVRAKNGRGIIFSHYVRPISLPDSAQLLSDSEACFISGWDRYNAIFPQLPNILKVSSISILPMSSCSIKRENYTVRMTKAMLCAECSTTQKHLCPTDRGRTLICYINDNPVLMGLFSWGDGCEDVKVPGVYVHLPFFKQWIKNKINKM